MSFDIATHCQQKARENATTVDHEKYELLKKVINQAAETYGERDVALPDRTSTTRKQGHPFAETNGHVNLLGVRGMRGGKAEEDDTGHYDDTMFVVSMRNGERRVKEYAMATETYQLERNRSGINKKASAYLIAGQHRYELGTHRVSHASKTYRRLDDIRLVMDDGSIDEARSKQVSQWKGWDLMSTGHDFNSNTIKYRALVPEDYVVCLRDFSGNRELDEEERYRSWEDDGATKQQYRKDKKTGDDLEVEGYAYLNDINIHHSPWKDKSYTDGCQGVPDWEEYKDFIREVERDTSVRGTKGNELAETGRQTDGTRAVIYTLVTAEFVEQVANGEVPAAATAGGVAPAVEARDGHGTSLTLPFTESDADPFAAGTVEAYYDESEATPGGWYPIGANQTWHNGIHLTRPRHSVVRAVAAGELVAARLPSNDELGDFLFGSPGFALVKHTVYLSPDPNPPTLTRLVQGAVFRESTQADAGSSGWLPENTLVELTGEYEMHFYVRDVFPYADEFPGVVAASDDSHVGLNWYRARHPARAGKASDDTVWVGVPHEGAVAGVPRPCTRSKVTIKEDPDENPSGLNCRSYPDYGVDDNILGVIPEGGEVTLYSQAYAGGNWQAVRAPDHGIPFGWIYTAKKGGQDRVQELDEAPAERKEFFSLYMHAAREDQARTAEEIPWLRYYYPYLSDGAPADEVGVARLKEEAPCYAVMPDSTPQTVNHVVRPAGSLVAFMSRDGGLPQSSDWEFVVWYDAQLDTLESGFMDPGLLASLSGYDTGRILYDGDDGGLNCRATPELPQDGAPDNRVGTIPHRALVKLHTTGYEDDDGRKWKALRAEEYGVPLGWVVATGSNGKELATVPDEIRETAETLAKGELATPGVSVDAGSPVANVGLLHPAGLVNGNQDAYGIHLEIFSKENIFNEAHMAAGGWSLVEDDTDKDIILESEKTIEAVASGLEDSSVRNVLEKLGWGGSGARDAEDVQEMRETLSEHLPALRRLITHNTSYWAADWSKVKDDNPEWAKAFTLSDDDVAMAQRYAWWDACAGLKVAPAPSNNSATAAAPAPAAPTPTPPTPAPTEDEADSDSEETSDYLNDPEVLLRRKTRNGWTRTGDHVEALQRDLKKLGLDGGTSGVYDAATQGAVVCLQIETYYHVVDGRLDSQDALGEAKQEWIDGWYVDGIAGSGTKVAIQGWLDQGVTAEYGRTIHEASKHPAAPMGFIMLDRDNCGGGVYHYQSGVSGDQKDRDDEEWWGLPPIVYTLERVARKWAEAGHPQIQIGDMSKKAGGTFKPHSSHHKGRVADVRPMVASDADVGKALTVESGIYDLALSKKFMQMVYDEAPRHLGKSMLRTIIFGDSDIDENYVLYDAGHANHYHIKIPLSLEH